MDRLSDYDYQLPESAIAQVPLADRASSKLIWLKLAGGFEHHVFRDIPSILQPGDLLVVNNTRVSALRVFGERETGGKVELLLLHEAFPATFEVLAKPAKKLRPGTTIRFDGGLTADVGERLSQSTLSVTFETKAGWQDELRRIASAPLPPYIHEKLDDAERYQTVYAQDGGSAAAPTAGLHFTTELLNELNAMGVTIANVTLDVGLDTFRPVQSEVLDKHAMHGERCLVTQETAEAVANAKNRIVAVGTTAVRTLESMATGPRRISAGSKETKLFIRPGFKFQVIDGMFTNFHMPRTTMLMMISALAGRGRVFDAYAESLTKGYRFLSFGDSMLIL